MEIVKMKNSYKIHPRIVSWITRDWEFDRQWEMVKINKGIIDWIPFFACGLLILMGACLPIVASHRDFLGFLLFGVAVASVGLFGIVFNLKERKRYKPDWEYIQSLVQDFYDEFYIVKEGAQQLSYDEIIKEVRSVLIVIAGEIETSSGDLQAENRACMRRKFDVAQHCLSGGFNECRGYAFFFEALFQAFDPGI